MLKRCECGCEEMLTGRQTRFRNDKHRAAWWSRARKLGAERVSAVVREAAGDGAPVGVPGILAAGKKRGGIHRASLATSLRLQKLFSFLLSGPKTTQEIQGHLQSGSPGTDVSELRHNGYDIRARFLRFTADGRKVYLYTLIGGVAA